MRARLGRPDLTRWAEFADVPNARPAVPGEAVRVAWLGVSTLHVSDGSSALLTDGFFSRPGLLRTGLGRIRPDEGRIERALRRAGVEELEAVLPVHTHYDHVMDSATVARRTGADVVGGESAANVARGHGLPEDRIRVTSSGETVRLGAYDVTLVEGDHCPPDRFPGEITAPVPRSAGTRAYRCGEAWSTLVHHRDTGRRLLIQGSAGFVPGALEGQLAEVAYLGVGQLGLTDEDYTRTYWDETVGRVGARVVVLIHHDDFFQPLNRPVRALPYAADDFGVTMRRLTRLAARDGVRLHLPTLWERADPWLSLV